ncbi:MAG: TonB-dependent receptor [Xanthomonadales bacterium]|jgi:iron complex outermembrane receptor protein|nr:TonB-dependent receptor [Xanthomonadales bacterium]
MYESYPGLAPKRLCLALSAALGTMCFSPSWAETADYDEDAMIIEEVIVTGTRIKRSTNTRSQEVLVFELEDIQLSGDISVADALRSAPINSFGSAVEYSGWSAQSNATLDLRGVGAERNLVLLNGRRVVGSPSLWGSGTVNLNMIPYAAVDRIEIIADGASAVYGSDAVAGVTNVILKKNYQGMTLQARYGDRSEDDGTEESASLLIGAGGERSHITFSLEYDKRDPIHDADREYTRARWGDYNGDGVIMGEEETIGVSPYGYTLENPDWYWGIPYDPEDQSTWYWTPGADCTEGDGWTGIISAEAMLGPGAGFFCGYAYALVSTNRAGLERVNSYVSAGYELGKSVELFADVLISQIESFGRYAPPAAEGPPIPGDPRNDIGANWGLFRFVEIGNRDDTVTDYLTDINLGARGDWGETARWEVYYSYSDYVSQNIGNYYLSWAGLVYNFHNEVDAYDPFVANMKATTLNDDRQNLQKVFAGMQFDLFNMPAGPVSAYVGSEYFQIDYRALVDAQSEAGLIGGSAGSSAWGKRDVVALFAEAIVPLFDWWEFDLAVRYDDYSDFGNSTTPRVGTVLRIPGYDALRFKASWGEGFRAPNLSDLFGTEDIAYRWPTDWYGCQLNGIAEDDCTRSAVEVSFGPNPDLEAETSKSFSLGADWQFAGRWQASINYFWLELNDRHIYPGTQDELILDWYADGTNPRVHRNALGWADFVEVKPRNGKFSMQYESVDFALSGGIGTRLGEFGLQAFASHYITYEMEQGFESDDIENIAGTIWHPDWRVNVLLSWNLNGAFASVNWDYAASQYVPWADAQTDDWSVFNVSAGYDFGRFGTFTLGANNVLNRGPQLNPNGFPIDDLQYIEDYTGRVIYLSYRVEL